MSRRSLTLLVLAMLAVSCGAESQANPTSTSTSTVATTAITAPVTTVPTTTTTLVEVPVGYELVEIEDENIRLALPGAWVTVDLTQDDWEDLLAEGLGSLPEEMAIVDEAAEAIISQGGLLLAYDFANQDDDFVTNLNILSVERGPLDDPEVIIPVLTQQYEQIGAVDAVIGSVEVPLGPAIKASYGLPPETGFTHTAVQYYVFETDTVFIVTFSTESIVELEIVFDTIMSTFDAIN